MDRLAEITRTPQNRGEAIDFTRPQGTRTERREDGEVRAEEKVNDRERRERPVEKPERFSLQLAEQKAALETPPSAEAPTDEPVETESAQATATEPKKTDAEPQADAAEPTTTAPKRTGVAIDAQLSPQVEKPATEPTLAPEVATKPDAAKSATPAAPAVPLPAALIAPTAAAPMASAAKPAATEASIEPVITAAPRIDAEKQVLETETASSKIGAKHTDGAAMPLQDPTPKSEARTEAAQTTSTRETSTTRSAQELEHAADVLRQIRVQITPQMTEARIQLQPLELGRVSIHLSLENGRMKTTVRAEKTETLQAIQTHLPELRASLRQHGIDAQDFQLSLGFENKSSRDGDKPQQQSNTRTAAAEMTAVERSPSLRAALSKTGVDFYA